MSRQVTHQRCGLCAQLVGPCLVVLFCTKEMSHRLFICCCKGFFRDENRSVLCALETQGLAVFVPHLKLEDDMICLGFTLLYSNLHI